MKIPLPSSLKGRLIFGVITMTFLCFVWQGWTIRSLRGDLHERTVQRDSIAGEAVASRARAAGWEVRFAEETDRLGEELQGQDSLLDETLQDLDASWARVEQLTRVVVSLEGQISSPGVPERPPAADSSSVPTSWSGEYDDDLLRGTWTFTRLPRPILEMLYSANPEIELIQAESGDGRILVMARSPHPNVSPIFTQLTVDPPPPIVEFRCSLSRQGIVALVGFGIALVIH